MQKITLPEEYVPFDELVICGNTLLNGQVAIAVDNNPVFLLGKGDEVRVWLQVPTGNEWRYEIYDSQSDDSAYQVKRAETSIAVYFGPHLILRAEQKSDRKIVVDHVDLTHFGLSIHGDSAMLKVGTTQLAGNVMDGVETMVNVG